MAAVGGAAGAVGLRTVSHGSKAGGVFGGSATMLAPDGKGDEGGGFHAWFRSVVSVITAGTFATFDAVLKLPPQRQLAAYTSLVAQWLQMVAFATSITSGYHWSSRILPVRVLSSLTTAQGYVAQWPDTTVYIVFHWISMAVTLLFIGAFVNCVVAAARGRLSASSWSVYAFRRLGRGTSTWAYIPLLYLLLSDYTCHTPMGPMMHPAVKTCYAGTHLAQTLVFTFVAAGYMALIFVYALMAVDNHPLSTAVNARSHARTDVVMLVLKTVLVFLVHLFPHAVGPVACIAVVFVTGVVWLVAHLLLLPFLHHRTNQLVAVLAGTNLWLAFCLVLQHPLPNFDAAIMLYMGLPFAGAAAYLACDARAAAIYRTPINRLESPYAVDLKLRYMLHAALFGHPTDEVGRAREGWGGPSTAAAGTAHRTSAPAAADAPSAAPTLEDLDNVDDTDARMLQVRAMMKPEALREVQGMLKAGLAQWYSSTMLHITSAWFYFIYCNNAHLCMSHCMRAERSRPAWDVRYFAHRVLKLADDQNSGKAQIASISRLAFEQHMADARIHVRKALTTQISFWAELMDAKPDLSRCHTLASDLNKSINAAEAAFRELMAINSQSLSLLRLFASFTMYVTNHMERANVLITEAERLEEAQTREYMKEGHAVVRLLEDTPLDVLADDTAVLMVGAAPSNLGIILSVSPFATKLFGHPRWAMERRNLSMLMPNPFAENHDSFLRAYLDTGEGVVVRHTRVVFGLHKLGHIFPLLVAVREQPVEDGSPVFMAIARAVRTAENHILMNSDFTVTAASEGSLVAMGMEASSIAHGDTKIQDLIVEWDYVLTELKAATGRGVALCIDPAGAADRARDRAAAASHDTRRMAPSRRSLGGASPPPPVAPSERLRASAMAGGGAAMRSVIKTSNSALWVRAQLQETTLSNASTVNVLYWVRMQDDPVGLAFAREQRRDVLRAAGYTVIDTAPQQPPKIAKTPHPRRDNTLSIRVPGTTPHAAAFFASDDGVGGDRVDASSTDAAHSEGVDGGSGRSGDEDDHQVRVSESDFSDAVLVDPDMSSRRSWSASLMPSALPPRHVPSRRGLGATNPDGVAMPGGGGVKAAPLPHGHPPVPAGAEPRGCPAVVKVDMFSPSFTSVSGATMSPSDGRRTSSAGFGGGSSSEGGGVPPVVISPKSALKTPKRDMPLRLSAEGGGDDGDGRALSPPGGPTPAGRKVVVLVSHRSATGASLTAATMDDATAAQDGRPIYAVADGEDTAVVTIHDAVARVAGGDGGRDAIGLVAPPHDSAAGVNPGTASSWERQRILAGEGSPVVFTTFNPTASAMSPAPPSSGDHGEEADGQERRPHRGGRGRGRGGSVRSGEGGRNPDARGSVASSRRSVARRLQDKIRRALTDTTQTLLPSLHRLIVAGTLAIVVIILLAIFLVVFLRSQFNQYAIILDAVKDAQNLLINQIGVAALTNILLTSPLSNRVGLRVMIRDSIRKYHDDHLHLYGLAGSIGRVDVYVDPVWPLVQFWNVNSSTPTSTVEMTDLLEGGLAFVDNTYSLLRAPDAEVNSARADVQFILTNGRSGGVLHTAFNATIFSWATKNRDMYTTVTTTLLAIFLTIVVVVVLISLGVVVPILVSIDHARDRFILPFVQLPLVVPTKLRAQAERRLRLLETQLAGEDGTDADGLDGDDDDQVRLDEVAEGGGYRRVSVGIDTPGAGGDEEEGDEVDNLDWVAILQAHSAARGAGSVPGGGGKLVAVGGTATHAGRRTSGGGGGDMASVRSGDTGSVMRGRGRTSVVTGSVLKARAYRKTSASLLSLMARFLTPMFVAILVFAVIFAVCYTQLTELQQLQSGEVVAALRAVGVIDVPSTLAVMVSVPSAAAASHVARAKNRIDDLEFQNRLLVFGDGSDPMVEGAARMGSGSYPLLSNSANDAIRTINLGDACAYGGAAGLIRNATECTLFREGAMARGMDTALRQFLQLSRFVVAKKEASMANASMPYMYGGEIATPELGAVLRFGADFLSPLFIHVADLIGRAVSERLDLLQAFIVAITVVVLVVFALYQLLLFNPKVYQTNAQIKEERIMMLLLPSTIIQAVPQLQALVAAWVDESVNDRLGTKTV